MRAPHRPRTGSYSPSALALRARVMLRIVLLALLFVPSRSAAEPPPPTALHDARDIRIALRVRRALAQDTELAQFSVYVSAVQGKVTLWGRLPNEAVVQRALQIARCIQGVLQIRSEFTVGPVEPNRDETPRLPTAIAVPHAGTQPGRRDPHPAGMLAGSAKPIRPSLDDAAWLGQPVVHKPPAADSAATLLPPSPRKNHDDLASAVTRLIQADVRLEGIWGEVREGVVTLGGHVARMEQVLELARQVAQIPGVKQVVVEGVRVAPR
jgi:osmotically-inducible protein OsmY